MKRLVPLLLPMANLIVISHLLVEIDNFSQLGLWNEVIAFSLLSVGLSTFAVIGIIRWCLLFDMEDFHDKKAAWSRKTFGPGDRYSGVVAHIRKELNEIEENPHSLEEWVDVILLAMDGAWRSAEANGKSLTEAMQAKQRKNEKRKWPEWTSLKEGEVSEHIRGEHD